MYDQELSYIIDNPDGSALFLSRVVTIEGQERDNQMTTGVIQSTDFRIMLFRLEVNPGRWGWQLQQMQMKILEGYKQNPELPRLILKLMRAEGRRHEKQNDKGSFVVCLTGSLLDNHLLQGTNMYPKP